MAHLTGRPVHNCIVGFRTSRCLLDARLLKLQVKVGTFRLLRYAAQEWPYMVVGAIASGIIGLQVRICRYMHACAHGQRPHA